MPFIGGAVSSVCVQFQFLPKCLVDSVAGNARRVLVIVDFIMHSTILLGSSALIQITDLTCILLIDPQVVSRDVTLISTVGF